MSIKDYYDYEDYTDEDEDYSEDAEVLQVSSKQDYIGLNRTINEHKGLLRL